MAPMPILRKTTLSFSITELRNSNTRHGLFDVRIHVILRTYFCGFLHFATSSRGRSSVVFSQLCTPNAILFLHIRNLSHLTSRISHPIKKKKIQLPTTTEVEFIPTPLFQVSHPRKKKISHLILSLTSSLVFNNSICFSFSSGTLLFPPSHPSQYCTIQRV